MPEIFCLNLKHVGEFYFFTKKKHHAEEKQQNNQCSLQFTSRPIARIFQRGNKYAPLH